MQLELAVLYRFVEKLTVDVIAANRTLGRGPL